MNDDLDRDLLRVFATTAAALPDDDFLRGTARRLASQRRLRTVLRLGVLLLSLLILGFFTARLFVTASLVVSERFGELLISPLGWTLSLLFAVAVMRRRRLW